MDVETQARDDYWLLTQARIESWSPQGGLNLQLEVLITMLGGVSDMFPSKIQSIFFL